MLLFGNPERHDPAERVYLRIDVRVAHYVQLALSHLKLFLQLLIHVLQVVVIVPAYR